MSGIQFLFAIATMAITGMTEYPFLSKVLYIVAFPVIRNWGTCCRATVRATSSAPGLISTRIHMERASVCLFYLLLLLCNPFWPFAAPIIPSPPFACRCCKMIIRHPGHSTLNNGIFCFQQSGDSCLHPVLFSPLMLYGFLHSHDIM